MKTIDIDQTHQTQTGPKTGPTITLDYHTLSKAGINLVWHKFRPSDLGVDATFAVKTWSFWETVEEGLGMFEEYTDDADDETKEKLEKLAEEGAEDCLISCARDKLAECGVPYKAQIEAELTEKSHESIVEIKCSFLIESLDADRHEARAKPLCSVSVDGDNFTFTAKTNEAIMTAAMDASGDYAECEKRSLLEQFGQLEAYCLPWHTHWLLERGYDVSLTQISEETRFHVHFHDYRVVPYSGDIDEMLDEDLLLLKNPARPILRDPC